MFLILADGIRVVGVSRCELRRCPASHRPLAICTRRKSHETKATKTNLQPVHEDSFSRTENRVACRKRTHVLCDLSVMKEKEFPLVYMHALNPSKPCVLLPFKRKYDAEAKRTRVPVTPV